MKLTTRDKKLLSIALRSYLLVTFVSAAVVLYTVRSVPALLLFLAVVLLIPASIRDLRSFVSSE